MGKLFRRRHAKIDPDLIPEHVPVDPTFARPRDMDELAEHLRGAGSEFAPRTEYSIDRVESFLSRHIKELQETQAELDHERDVARDHLAELERRRTVTKIAHDALSDTLANVTQKVAALAGPARKEPPVPATPASTETMTVDGQDLDVRISRT